MITLLELDGCIIIPSVPSLATLFVITHIYRQKKEIKNNTEQRKDTIINFHVGQPPSQQSTTITSIVITYGSVLDSCIGLKSINTCIILQYINI